MVQKVVKKKSSKVVSTRKSRRPLKLKTSHKSPERKMISQVVHRGKLFGHKAHPKVPRSPSGKSKELKVAKLIRLAKAKKRKKK